MAKKPTAPAPNADQPYYLQRAHIKDFRSIRDAAAEFKPGLNIIIGANGSGKTNFVRCIQNGLSKTQVDFDGNFHLFVKGRDSFEVQFSPVDNESLLNPQSYILNGENTPQIVFTSFTGAKFNSDSFHHAQLMSKRTSEIIVTGESFLRLVTIDHGVPINYPIIDTPEEFYINLRSVGMNTYDTSTFAQTFASSITSNFLSINFSQKKDRKLPTREEVGLAISKIEAFYSELLLQHLKHVTSITDIRISSSYTIYTNPTQQQVIVKGIALEYKVNQDWLPFSALSSGTQRLFYIISEITASFIRIPASIFKEIHTSDKIILLEEPELGIHPDQLEKLLVFLREQSQKYQFIITTHSPQVLDMLNDDELDRITICELDKKKGTQFRKLKRTQIAAAKKYMSTQGLYLSDYWRYGNLEITQ
jgi:predicted ATP-dependent endonuclease of OLD family